MYNFNKHIYREHTNSQKWNKKLLLEYFGVDDLLPFWIADMDFLASNEIRKDLADHAFDKVFGYDKKNDTLIDAVISWHKKRFDWQIQKEDIRFAPSVLNSITSILNIYTKKGDGVIIQTPAFPKFRAVVIKNDRKTISNPLKLVDGKYEIDFEDLEKKASNPNNKVLILCNPHNPIGRAWSKKELQKIEEISTKHNILVITDEIHNGIILNENRFIPYSSISENARQNSITCISPAKTFNIASVSDSIVLIANKQLREKFDKYMENSSNHKINTFNLIAMEAAYSKSDQWLDGLLEYLQENLEFMKNYIKEHIPKIKLIEPEATFLVWLDFRELNFDTKELEKFLVNEAKLALNSGHWFGKEGAGFARMGIACSRSMLKQGLENLKNAVDKI